MFDLNKIILWNFGSYRGQHEFEFPTTPGLYSLTGVNEENPRLGANGTGKSTLLNAIRWCFYGRTSRGLKASDVVAWEETSCRVTTGLTINDQHFAIVRSQSPNGLTINGRVVDQDEVQKLLRLTADQFDHSVMLPQF